MDLSEGATINVKHHEDILTNHGRPPDNKVTMLDSRVNPSLAQQEIEKPQDIGSNMIDANNAMMTSAQVTSVQASIVGSVPQGAQPVTGNQL
ncbi:hypothetical protein SESBI_44239 [Sesbania bispinosa]|nr:hypothetical protein SESBI_44239 [Sesbania bispinosa]